MDVERKLYIGLVEENVDPRRQGRVKVRVQTLYHEISVEDIPWAAPFSGLAGKEFQIPAIGKLVNVMFFQNDLYDPYYMYSENYNINLQNKLKDLSDDEYKNFVALLFDERTQIYADSKEFTIDHLFNKITIDETSINLELKDNMNLINLGSKNATQDAVLGTNFFDWMDKLVMELSNPVSWFNGGGFVAKPGLIYLGYEYWRNREQFLSKNVKIVNNIEVDTLSRPTSNIQNDDTIIEMSAELQAKINEQNEKSCEKLTKNKASDELPIDSGDFVIPMIGVRISSRWGERDNPYLGKTGYEQKKRSFHYGVDIAGPIGSSVYAITDGVVEWAAFIPDGKRAAGNTIMIWHTGINIGSAYFHVSKILVKVGQNVKKGQEIAKSGIAGTGAHLHFAIYKKPGRTYINPETFITWPIRQGDAAIKDTSTPAKEYQGSKYISTTPTNSDCGDFDKSSNSQYDEDTNTGNNDIVLEGDFYDKTSKLIISFEGFISKSQYDVNAYRVGYGSDTITRDGKVHNVEKDGPYSITTKEEARIDLIRRIKKEKEQTVIKQVGGSVIYNQIPDNVKIALISLAYNYGSILSGNDRKQLVAEIKNAIKEKTWDNVGKKLVELTYNHNMAQSENVKNALRRRRKQESALISKGGEISHLA